jgi:ABC-type nitrate/sulfonate/bicarbonate transport system ATPase subunit
LVVAAGSTASPELEVSGLSMRFGRGRGHLPVLDRVGFSLAAGRFLAIVGPNGCGKTTLLRLIAGLLSPSQGVIVHGGRPVTDPDKSRLLMFQQPTLFPWMTVDRNIDFALRARGVAPTLRAELTRKYVRLVGLSGFKGSDPRQLSGGMQQRAELARALAVSPRLLLMDEPSAALDALTRVVLQEELSRLRAHHDTTFVMITHDVQEAVFLSDQVLVMSRRPGRVKRIVPVERDRAPRGDGAAASAPPRCARVALDWVAWQALRRGGDGPAGLRRRDGRGAPLTRKGAAGEYRKYHTFLLMQGNQTGS